jgi:hypothetical protein
MVKYKPYPKGLMMIPNQKNTDFKYFQSGYGLIYKWNNAFKPRFIYTCARFLFDSKLNNPYTQFQDALQFLKYIFKDRNTKLPSRQELANIVSIAQLIKDGYETYTRSDNQISISLNKATVQKRWKEIYGVNKRSAQLEIARDKRDMPKRKGKKLFKDLEKYDQRERTNAIKSQRTFLKNIKEEWEVLNNHVNQIEKLMGARSTFGMTVMSRKNTMGLDVKLTRIKEKRDIKRDEILRLERTLANIDPKAQPDMSFNYYERQMKKEIQEQIKKVSYHDTSTGKLMVGLEKEKIDWTRMVSGNFDRSSKHINVRETIYDTTTKRKK